MTEIHFDFLNFNSLLIILFIILVAAGLYYEIYKLKCLVAPLLEINNSLSRHIITNPIENVVEVEMGQEADIQQRRVGQEPSENWGAIHQQMNDQDISCHSDDNYDDHDDNYDDHDDNYDDHDDNSEVSDHHNDNVNDKENDYSEGVTNYKSVNIDEILEGKNIITDNSLSDILNVDEDLSKIDDFIATIKESEASKTPDYDKMTVSELKNILSDMSLPVSGNKTKLIKRIKEENAEHIL